MEDVIKSGIFFKVLLYLSVAEWGLKWNIYMAKYCHIICVHVGSFVSICIVFRFLEL